MNKTLHFYQANNIGRLQLELQIFLIALLLHLAVGLANIAQPLVQESAFVTIKSGFTDAMDIAYPI